jgi:hypothetical protein
MAIAPNPQILLGCSGLDTAPYAFPLSVTAPGSVVVSAIDGSTIAADCVAVFQPVGTDDPGVGLYQMTR